MVDDASTQTPFRRLSVFLCHDLRDKKDTVHTSGQSEKGIVLQLSEWLEAHDIDVWRSDKKLVGGEAWKREIYEKAIPTCDLFIVCLTKNFADDTPGQRHREVIKALEIAETKHPGTTFIIPIRIEQVHYPGLGEKQYINYYKHQDFNIILPLLYKKRKFIIEYENQKYDNEEVMPSRERPLPTNSESWIHQGDVLCNQKYYEEALFAYEQAIVLGERQSDAYRKKGDLLFYLLSRYSEAITVYDQASQLNSKFVDVHNKKAIILDVYQKRGQDALASYQRVIELEPQNDEAYSCKGKVFFHLKRYEEALAAYEAAIALNSNFTEAWYGKSDTLSQLGRTAEAQQAYKKADQLVKGDENDHQANRSR